MAGATEPLSFDQQADLVEGIVTGCTMMGGEDAAETHVTLSAADAGRLRHLAQRLRRMAPYEREIRRLVTRK